MLDDILIKTESETGQQVKHFTVVAVTNLTKKWVEWQHTGKRYESL